MRRALISAEWECGLYLCGENISYRYYPTRTTELDLMLKIEMQQLKNHTARQIVILVSVAQEKKKKADDSCKRIHAIMDND